MRAKAAITGLPLSVPAAIIRPVCILADTVSTISITTVAIPVNPSVWFAMWNKPIII